MGKGDLFLGPHGEDGTEHRGIGGHRGYGPGHHAPYGPYDCAVGLRGGQEALLGKMLLVLGNFFPLPFAELG
jgi:hypothetical protein